jgi:hypothetical protein
MIQTIREYVAGSSGEDGHNGKIGEITGREQQRPRQPDEFRERPFEVVVDTVMSAHQMRGAGSETKMAYRFGGGFGDARIRRQTQIVVAAEGQIVPAVNPDMRALRRIEQTASAVQALPFDIGKFGGEIAHYWLESRFDDRTKHRIFQPVPVPSSRISIGLMPSLSNSIRSRSATGLRVVNSFSP